VTRRQIVGVLQFQVKLEAVATSPSRTRTDPHSAQNQTPPRVQKVNSAPYDTLGDEYIYDSLHL
jgi:hypothetical protein